MHRETLSLKKKTLFAVHSSCACSDAPAWLLLLPALMCCWHIPVAQASNAFWLQYPFFLIVTYIACNSDFHFFFLFLSSPFPVVLSPILNLCLDKSCPPHPWSVHFPPPLTRVFHIPSPPACCRVDSPHSNAPFRHWKVWQLAMHAQMKLSGWDALGEHRAKLHKERAPWHCTDALLQGNSTWT